jgi:hypothetical protein
MRESDRRQFLRLSREMNCGRYDRQERLASHRHEQRFPSAEHDEDGKTGRQHDFFYRGGEQQPAADRTSAYTRVRMAGDTAHQCAVLELGQHLRWIQRLYPGVSD